MEVLAASETDPAELREALSDIEVRPVRGKVTDAVTFAAALAEGQPDAEIVLASDGNFEPAPNVVVSAPVRYIDVGESSDNQAVVTLSISDVPGEREAAAFVQLANASGAAASRRVETRLDGQLYDVRDVEIPAGGRVSYTLSIPEEVRLVEARLRGEDALGLDDAAWAAIPPADDARVTLVTDGNRYLETALGLLPTVSAVTLHDSDTLSGPFELSDVAVLDGLVPPHLPPGNLLIFGPKEPMPGVTIVGELVAPVPEVAVPDHRMVSGARMEDVAVLSASAVELSPDWTPLVVAEVEGREWPLIAEGSLAGRRAVLVAFDLRQSDLPLRPAFPLLMSGALEHLAPASVVGLPASVEPGQTVELRLSPEVNVATIVDPAGHQHSLDVATGVARFSETGSLGPYLVQLRTGGGIEELYFAVNLHADEESAVKPMHRPLRRAEGESPAGISFEGRRELWWMVAAVALGLLAIEWAYDHRATIRRAAGAVASRQAGQ
jgi:hypothetical protein